MEGALRNAWPRTGQNCSRFLRIRISFRQDYRHPGQRFAIDHKGVTNCRPQREAFAEDFGLLTLIQCREGPPGPIHVNAMMSPIATSVYKPVTAAPK